ncbi:MAG: hypothetical protein Q8T11_18035 [Elusimicrobiota bacterium]|nr:hypothetical protein [Elusimicrobiota bacterium]
MNTSTSWALMFALSLAAGSARAQGAALPLRDYPQTRVSDRQERGVVIAVDAAAGRLKIKDGEGKVRWFTASRAKVEAAQGKILSLADLSVGDEISVSYDVSLKGRDATQVLRLRKALKK